MPSINRYIIQSLNKKMNYDFLDELVNDYSQNENIVLFSSAGKELAQTFDLSE